MAVASVTYAGVNLPVWTPAADARMRQAGWTLDQVYRFADAPDLNLFDHLPFPPRMEPPPVRGGVLWWPTGASQFARVHFLCDRATLDAIKDQLVTDAGSPDAGYLPAELNITDGRGGTDFTGDMHFLPPLPLHGADLEVDSYLLTLVDERYFWWFKPSVNLSAVTTWTGMYSALGTGLGSSVTVDGSVSSFAAPSTRWATLGTLPLPLLLDAAAWSTGRRIIRFPGGGVHATDYATAKAAAAAVRAAWGTTYRLRAGGPAYADDTQKNAPASLLVRGGGVDRTVTLSALAPADYGGVTGKAGYRATANVDALTLSVPQAEAFAAEWYNWRLADEDASYAGVGGFDPCGWWGAVEWVARADEWATRVLPFPLPLGHSAGGAPDTVFALNTQNTDGTEIDPTTTDLRTDKTTGLLTTQGGGVTTHSGIDAGPAQTGMVNTSTQIFEGEKRFNANVVRTEDANTAHSGSTLMPLSSLTVSPSVGAAVRADATATAACVVSALVNGSGAGPVAAVTAAANSGGVPQTYAQVYSEYDTANGRGYSLVYASAKNGAGATAGIGFAVNPIDGVRGVNFLSASFPSVGTDGTYDLYADPADLSGGVYPVRCSRVFTSEGFAARVSGTDHAGLTATVSGLQYHLGLYTGGTFSGGAVADADYGDITVSGGGTAWAIDNNAVTYAKMQDVSAASRLLGRGAGGGAGDPQEVGLGPGLTMAGTTLDTSGVSAVVLVGTTTLTFTNGVLTSVV